MNVTHICICFASVLNMCVITHDSSQVACNDTPIEIYLTSVFHKVDIDIYTYVVSVCNKCVITHDSSQVAFENKCIVGAEVYFINVTHIYICSECVCHNP